MNSKELWELLEKTETKEIMIMATMIVRYLDKARQLKIDYVLKEIKKANKFLGV